MILTAIEFWFGFISNYLIWPFWWFVVSSAYEVAPSLVCLLVFYKEFTNGKAMCFLLRLLSSGPFWLLHYLCYAAASLSFYVVFEFSSLFGFIADEGTWLYPWFLTSLKVLIGRAKSLLDVVKGIWASCLFYKEDICLALVCLYNWMLSISSIVGLN